MGQLLTTASILQCPHGGIVKITSSNTRAKASGAAIVRTSDTFSVVGCTFTVGQNLHPCATVEWTAGAAHVDALGADVVTTSQIGLCKAADGVPQGTVSVKNTQARASGT